MRLLSRFRRQPPETVTWDHSGAAQGVLRIPTTKVYMGIRPRPDGGERPIVAYDPDHKDWVGRYHLPSTNKENNVTV